MSNIIRIGTRKSALALIQTHLIADGLKRAWPDIKVELVTKETLGDKILDKPLQEFGGKGVFVSEFEQAMKEGAIDLAVHSAKDLPMELGEGLVIAAVSGRGDPRDVLVTMKGSPKDREHIVIGTSSPRRQLEAVEYRGQLWPGAANLTCATLRGNVHTRLRKLEEGLYDGIILAAAGLERLDLLGNPSYDFKYLDPTVFIPAGGQGIMAVEAREGSDAARLCQAIDSREGRLCLTLERMVLKLLDAGCHEPIGIYSNIMDGKMEVWGISRPDRVTRRISLEGAVTEKELEALALQAGRGLM